MKKLILLIGLSLISLSSFAKMPWQEGRVFTPATNAQVIWSATNQLPAAVWIYKVVPHSIPEATISNAMRIGEFKLADKAKKNPPNLPDKSSMYFQNNNESGRPRMLSIIPSLGAIDYSSEVDARAPIENVPSADEAEQMGRQILFLLGVDRSLINERARRGYDQTRTKYAPDGKMGETKVTHRGVAFERRIDGLSLSENSFFTIHLGSNGTITDFHFFWRNIVPSSSHPVNSPEQILKLIKSRQAEIPWQPTEVEALMQAEKFEVKKVVPSYYNGYRDEKLDYLYPYAEVEMSASIKGENVTFYLLCPLVTLPTAPL